MKIYCPRKPLRLVAVATGLHLELPAELVELAGLDACGAGRPQWRDGGTLPRTLLPFVELDSLLTDRPLSGLILEPLTPSYQLNGWAQA